MQAGWKGVADERGDIFDCGVSLLGEYALGVQINEGRVLFQQELGEIGGAV